MYEGPARQNGASNLLFVTRGVRDGASQSARRYNACEQPVCTENLDSDVMVMKPTKDRVRFDASDRLNRARDWRIFIQ